MVDFQSRDTRRSLDDEDGGDDTAGTDEEAEADGETETPEPSEGGTDAGGGSVPMPDEVTYATVAVGERAGDPAAAATEPLAAERVVARTTAEPTVEAVRAAVDRFVGREDIAVVLTVGGVGVGPEDVTPEAVEPLFDAHLPGFGELYRALSHEGEGTAVLRSRVTAGLVGPAPVFCLPGDPAGARRAVARLVEPEAAETVATARGR